MKKNLILLGCIVGMSAHAEPERYSQLLLGQLNLTDEFVNVNIGDGQEYRAKVDDLPMFVGAFQEINGGNGWLEYGWEGGISLSWQNDSVTVSGCSGCGDGGATISFSIENELYLLGSHLGALINVPFARHSRWFASAGPMITLASLSAQETDTADNIDDGPPIQLDNQRETSLDFGWYANTGIAFALPSGWELGVAYRYQDFNVDFSDSYAEVAYRGQQLMFMINSPI